MDRAAGSGIELNQPPSDLEVFTRPDGTKFYTRDGGSNYPVFGQPYESNRPLSKGQSRSRAAWVLAVITIVCLAVALGAGLGAGLAAQHKSSSSSGTSNTVTKASNTATASGSVTTITPTSSTPPSPICPAANGSTYIATNKPLPTIASQLNLQIAEPNLSFEILCNTNFAEASGSSIIDIQLITNVSTLEECLDACALFSFQTRLEHFPENACTGVALGTSNNLETDGDDWQICWLKSNVTLQSPNGTSNYPGNYDGAVLLNQKPDLG